MLCAFFLLLGPHTVYYTEQKQFLTKTFQTLPPEQHKACFNISFPNISEYGRIWGHSLETLNVSMVLKHHMEQNQQCRTSYIISLLYHMANYYLIRHCTKSVFTLCCFIVGLFRSREIMTLWCWHACCCIFLV